MAWESVEEWRRSVPWNNAQIEIALRDEAEVQPNDYMRRKYLKRADYLAKTGHFTSRTLTQVIGRLVKKCGICGAPAIYRQGYHGRCSEHRHVLSAHNRWVIEKHDRNAEFADHYQAEGKKRDAAREYSIGRKRLHRKTP